MEKFNLYYTDVFYYKTTFQDKNIDLKVNYKSIDDVTTNNLKGKLLQSILLYDSIVIHAWDLPAIIHFFDGRKNAENIAENGLIKLLNCRDSFLGCQKDDIFSTLAGGEYTRDSFSCEDEINSMLQSFRGNHNDYKFISKSLYQNRLDINTDDMIMKLEKEIKRDISNPSFRKVKQLTTKKANQIYPQDVLTINTQLEAYRRIFIAEKANIDSIFAEDILIDVLKEKISDSLIKNNCILDINSEFSKLTKVVKVPDIVQAVNQKILTTEDVLKIRNKKHCQEFRKWIHTNSCFELSQDDNYAVIAAYTESLGKREVMDKLPVKVLRFVATNALGMIPGINILLNLGVSFADSFILDKIKTWKPQVFIDDYKKVLEKKI